MKCEDVLIEFGFIGPVQQRIYTVAEFYAEKPKGESLVRDDLGKLFRVFQCHGCQSCFEYDDDTDSVRQLFPHLYRCDEVSE